MRTRVVAVLLSLTASGLAGGSAFADYYNPDTDWIRDGKYGIHVRYLNGISRNATTIEEFNRWVDAFDVNAFAEDIERTGGSLRAEWEATNPTTDAYPLAGRAHGVHLNWLAKGMKNGRKYL